MFCYRKTFKFNWSLTIPLPMFNVTVDAAVSEVIVLCLNVSALWSGSAPETVKGIFWSSLSCRSPAGVPWNKSPSEAEKLGHLKWAGQVTSLCSCLLLAKCHTCQLSGKLSCNYLDMVSYISVSAAAKVRWSVRLLLLGMNSSLCIFFIFFYFNFSTSVHHFKSPLFEH